MKLQLQPERWLCLPTAFAMAMEMPVAKLLKAVGHDGSEIIRPELAEPFCRKGIHPQECIEVALMQGFAVTPVEVIPSGCSIPGLEHFISFGEPFPDANWLRWNRHLKSSQGVITGVTQKGGGHAVAYNFGRIFDPDGGSEYDYSYEACDARKFITQCLWRVDRIT